MMTHEKQIPIWSYINFQILYQIYLAQQKSQLTTMTISEVIEKASSHIQSNIPILSFYSPVNAGSVFSFLYSLLVVPKELYKSDPNFFEGFEFNINDFFEFEVGSEKINNNKQLFRVLRNAVSHVNYLIGQDNKSIVLWNINNIGIIDVKINSDINKLGNFAVKFANYYTLKQNS